MYLLKPVPSHPQTPTTFSLQCSFPHNLFHHAHLRNHPLSHPYAHSYHHQSPQTPLAHSTKPFVNISSPPCFLKTTKIQTPSVGHIGQLPISSRHCPNSQ